MTTTKTGQNAETAVAEQLVREGYEILDQNWKTKICEIDIIARKNKVIYMVEVKYRQSLSQGGGLEYIGPKKQKQMVFAARVWCQQASWEGDWRLMAASVQGESLQNIDLIEII